MLKVIGAVATLALAVACPAWASDKERGPGDAGGKPAEQKRHDRGHLAPPQADGQDKQGKASDKRADARGTEPRRAIPSPIASDRAPATPGRGGDARGNAMRSGAGKPTPVIGGGIGGVNAPAQGHAAIGACPPGLARQNAPCVPPGLAKTQRSDGWGARYRADYFGIPVRSDGNYVYYNGYLIPDAGRAAYIPLLGGALAVGQLWPERYPFQPLTDWQNRFYGFDNPDQYRFTDNVIYRVEPETAAIEAVVALLTGSDFAVGSRLPSGYDIYNVPTAFRSRYADSDDALYRYADGRIYEVDPTTMLIARAIDLVL